jgi:hypothetical protein
MDRLSRAGIDVPGLEVRIVERCTSTNAVLACADSLHPVLLAAEEQSAGRGRHGRRWRSARGAGATFSIRRRMACEQRRLAGLSVAVGISSARALRGLGARGVSLKWPNDLMVSRRKLGGILNETRPLPYRAVRRRRRRRWIVGNRHQLPRAAAGLSRARPGRRALDRCCGPPGARATAVIGAVAREVLALSLGRCGERALWSRRHDPRHRRREFAR